MLKESDSGAEVISLESGEFIFVGGDAANCSQNTGRTMDMTGLNQEEVSVVRKIKNLVTENEALKGVLIKHNELIQVTFRHHLFFILLATALAGKIEFEGIIFMVSQSNRKRHLEVFLIGESYLSSLPNFEKHCSNFD